MKKYLKFIFIIVALFSITFNVKAEEESTPTERYISYVDDEANMYSRENEEKFQKQTETFTKYGYFAIKTVIKHDNSLKEYAEEYYKERFGESSGTILVIDWHTRELCIYSSGYSHTIITDEEAERIINETKESFKGNELPNGTSKVLYEIYKLYNPTSEVTEETIGDFKLIIEDEAKLFTEQDITRLQDKMTALTKYGHIALHTVPVGGNNYSSTADYADAYYHEKFGTESGSVFIIDMDKRMIYIFSDGYNYTIINDGKADIITDNIYQYASREDYYTCAYTAFDQMNTLLDGGKILEPMRHISNIFVAIILGFFINFLIVSSNAKIKKASAQNVLSKCDVDVKASNITGKKTGTHRVYSPQSSGGSSGGGGGGGGGHSGGGGGHSF
jgi:uncharacterized protein